MFSSKKARDRAEDVQETVQQLGEDMYSGVRQAAGQSCTWAKNNPWVAIGVGSLVGLLAGIYLTGKKGD